MPGASWATQIIVGIGSAEESKPAIKQDAKQFQPDHQAPSALRQGRMAQADPSCMPAAATNTDASQAPHDHPHKAAADASSQRTYKPGGLDGSLRQPVTPCTTHVRAHGDKGHFELSADRGHLRSSAAPCAAAMFSVAQPLSHHRAQVAAQKEYYDHLLQTEGVEDRMSDIPLDVPNSSAAVQSAST